MKNQDEQIDKLFRNGLDNYEETVSSSAWDSIEDQLPKKNSTKFYWVAASLATILITSTIAWNSILKNTNSFIYETSKTSLVANYPEEDFTPLPILIHTTTIIYIEKKVFVNSEPINTKTEADIIDIPSLSSTFDLKPIRDFYTLNTEISTISSVELVYNQNEPITIIYKKGDPKHPRLTKAANFFKDISEGERQLINFDKLSESVIARRESNNNSNN